MSTQDRTTMAHASATPPSPAVLPPNCTTEAEIPPPSVSVDWLGFTLRSVPVGDVLEMLQALCPGDFVPLDFGMLGYKVQLLGPGKCRLLFSENREDVHVELTGSWCHALDEAAMVGFLVWLSNNSAKMTRLDLAMDDFGKLITPTELYERSKTSEMVTHASRSGASHGVNIGGKDIFTLGSRTSRRFLRVYDKDVESKGLIPAIRWEMELKNEAAQAALGDLAGGVLVSVVWASHLVGFVDFREGVGRHTERRRRSGWFVQLVAAAEKASYSLPQLIRTLEQAAAWFQGHMAATLAMIVSVPHFGRRWLEDTLGVGRGNMRTRHYAMVAAAGVRA